MVKQFDKKSRQMEHLESQIQVLGREKGGTFLGGWYISLVAALLVRDLINRRLGF